MALQEDFKEELYVLWVDSDPEVAQETIITDAGYKFEYFNDTQKCIDYIKKNMDKKYIAGIITSSMSKCDKNGIAMMNLLIPLCPSMKILPVFAICSQSIKQHPCINIISRSKEEVQNKVVAAIKNIDMTKRLKCNAEGCNENHDSHYCKLCDKGNSDHRAMDCPNAVILYHGTQGKSFIPIIQKSTGNLRASKHGDLGTGVYFTDSHGAAEVIAMDFKPEKDQNGGCVIETRVTLGRIKDIGERRDYQGVWRNEGYDSCHALHPPWLSFKKGELKEWCVKDENKTRIRSVTLINTHIDEDIWCPRLTIILKGNSSINTKRISGGGWKVIQEKPDGYYFVYSKKSGKVLDVAGWSKEQGTKLHQWDLHQGNNQKFYFKYNHEHKKYTIRSKYSSLYLTITGNKNYDRAVQSPENDHLFELQYLSNNTYRINTPCGKVLDVAQSEGNGFITGDIIQHEWLGNDNQRFRIEKCQI